MVRRRAPWYLVAILFAIWAHGIFDNHLGESSKHVSPRALETSLVYLDRSLRLEEVAAGQSALVQWILYEPELNDTLQEARDVLELYSEDEDFSLEARQALAIVSAELETPLEDLSQLDDLTRATLENQPAAKSIRQDLTEKLATGNATWWEAKTASRYLQTQPDRALAQALEIQHASDKNLFVRTSIAYTIDWLLSIIGLAFIPHTIRVIRRGWSAHLLHRPVRYSTRWEPSLVVALFLAGDLLAGYFLTGVYTAASLFDTGFVFDVGVDTAWRLFAPGLALIVLFRKPMHAIRSLGMNTLPHWRIVLCGYAVLSWLNYGFNLIVEPWMEFDPTGGLDLTESGWGGLVYGLLSACIIAPIAEEVFYRGLLLRGLERRFGFWISASVVTLAFALAHYYDVFGLISVGMLGFAMVVIYRATGSLTTVIVLHALYNLSITVPQWLMFHAKL